MDGDQLLEAVNILIEQINNIDAISEKGLKDTDFPDRVIASLHNHLGNVKHFVSDISSAFNASDQFLAIEAAERQLSEASDDLLQLHQHNLLNDLQYQKLSDAAHELDELFRKATDPEYI